MLIYISMLAKIIHQTLIILIIIQSSQQLCSGNSREFLVTFHPHLDAFWLNTDTELKNINFEPASFLYQMNQRNSKTILNSMLQALTQSPSRKHFITEIVFFKDWYEYLNDNDKKAVQKLVKNRQFEIVNAGWVQNDQAVCYFDDILDQYTLGLSYLKTQLNYTTQIGWATDCFGHSHSQVALQHLLGFQFQGIERVDERYIHQRKNGSLLEFYWSPVSDSNNLTYGGLVTLVRHFLHQVNNLRTVTPQNIVSDFEKIDKIMENLYHSPKLFRFLGNDFEEFIPAQFQKLQKAMEILNLNEKNSSCPVYKYGNPSDYLSLMKNVYDQDSLPVRNFDFMPNWDQDHYWTGYYTTDPDLKKICKDFSRLVNFYRKVLIKTESDQSLLNKSNELLALMQHHDAITATAKRHIQKEMKDRMKTNTDQLVEDIKKIKAIQKTFCSLYSNGNRCSLDSKEDTVYLSILHEGSQKKEQIEIELQKDHIFEIKNIPSEIFCFNVTSRCILVFQADLYSGQNVFKLDKVSSDQKISAKKRNDLTFTTKYFSLYIKGYIIYYTFDQKEYFNISLVKARSSSTRASTVSWNKYGRRQIKTEQRISGMYIMTNNAVLEPIDSGNYTSLEVAEGKHFTKIVAYSQLNTLTLTIKNGQYSILDIQNTFQPPNLQLSDYFLRVESNIDPKDDFFHDMNGYLVMKRKIGFRPDYEWQYKVIDQISANTYPLCSFAYILQNQKKFVIFNDRAAGISLYDKAFLLNIDRITGDDYKGVGQGYTESVKNTFHHKIALTGKEDVLERQWQREYDEPLLGFFTPQPRTTITMKSKQNGYLKYTVFNLNKNEFVLRLINLHDHKVIKIPKFGLNSWKLTEVGLNLEFTQIRESFAQGEPISQRRKWKNIANEVNVSNSGQLDTDSELGLRPLQIRSFRISVAGRKES